MKRFISPGLPLLLFIVGVVPAVRAQSSILVQEAPFSFEIGETVEGDGRHEYNITEPNAFTFTFEPFDLSLGTLESFTIAWDLTVTGTVSTSNGVSVSSGNGSDFILGGVQYGGTGSGASGVTTATFSLQRGHTFLASDAGIIYDPALYDRVTGASNYNLVWEGRPRFTIDNGIDGEIYSASAIGSVSVTYTYSAIPEPSTYALILGCATLGFVAWRRRRKIGS